MRRLLGFSLLAFIAWSCQPEKAPKIELSELVPPNTAWVAQINDWEELAEGLENSPLYQDLNALERLKNIEQSLRIMAYDLGRDTLLDLLEDRPHLLCKSLSGADRYAWLLLLEIKPRELTKLNQVLAQKKAKVQVYGQDTLQQWSLDEQHQVFLHLNQQFLALSNERFSIESVLRQLEQKVARPDLEELQTLMNNRNEKSQLNLYLSLTEAPDYLKLLSPEKILAEDIGAWASLDLDLERDQIIGSGLIKPELDRVHQGAIFKDIPAQEAEAAKIIPINVAHWIHWNVGNVGQFQRNRVSFFEQTNRLKAHQDRLAKLEITDENTLLGIIDNEMGVFQAGSFNGVQLNYAYARLRDAELAETTLSGISFQDGENITGHRGLVIRRLKELNLFNRVFGSLFADQHRPYYFIYQDYLIMCEEVGGLKYLLNDLLENKVLAQSDSYLNLERALPNRYHLRVLASPNDFLQANKASLDQKFEKELRSISDSLVNLRWAVGQIRYDQDYGFFSGILKREKRLKEKIVRQWTAKLPAPLKGEPKFLLNHLNQKYDIAVSDEENHLMLLDRKGEMLWRKALDGPIIGSIYQVDLYKNRKLQMVFNTANKLYVVDRLGRDVEGFPVSFPQAASAPVAVFDYDQVRNYRFVVPLGKKLANYDAQGKVVKGWNFKAAKSDILFQPQHFSVAGRDLIVTYSEEGKLFQLNRRGEERFKAPEGDALEELKPPFFLKERESLAESELIAGSNSGRMYVIQPEGRIDAVYLDRAHPAEHLLYFADRYIFSDEELLFVKDENQPFNASLEGPISTRPKAMISNNRFYLAAFSAQAEEIRLFNEEGQLVEGFPVFAQGPFDMGSLNRDQHLNIVTYSKDGTLICYQLR